MLKDVKQTYWKLAAVFTGVSMPLIIFGPAVMGFFLVAGIILGLVATKGNSLRASVALIKSSRVVHVTGVIMASFFMSAVLSVNVEHSMDKFLDILGIAVLAFGLYLSLREMPIRHVELTYRSFAVSLIAVAVLVLVDGLNIAPRLTAMLHGVDAVGDNTRLTHMSGVFAVLSPFLWAWLLRMYKQGEVLAGWLAFPASILSVLAIFVCGGFAGWLALLVSLIFFASYAMRYHGMHTTLKGMFVAAITLVLGPVSYLYAKGLLFKPMFGLDVLGARIAEYFVGRVDTWVLALDELGHNIFFGTGINTFKGLQVENETLAHPHNFILQLLLETGVVGTLLTLLVFGMMIQYFVRASRTNLYGCAGFAALVAFFISALANTSIFHPWWLTFLVFTGVFAARVGWAVTKKS